MFHAISRHGVIRVCPFPEKKRAEEGEGGEEEEEEGEGEHHSTRQDSMGAKTTQGARPPLGVGL